jgi:hypothetical protein
MNYKLTNAEKETITTSNRLNKTAEIYTSDDVEMRYYDKLCEKYPEHYKVIKVDSEGDEVISKNYLVAEKKLSRCKIPKILSEEQKNKLSQHMKKIRAKRKQL